MPIFKELIHFPFFKKFLYFTEIQVILPSLLKSIHTKCKEKKLHVMNTNCAYPYHLMGLILSVYQNKCVIDTVLLVLYQGSWFT